ncbi:hypothetical protein [Pseudomonas quasicaspiana]|uniref:hypothetical protein n=1 Tax=Pseudomonas quasicaspiana TaxID=2829821 RepID=UPI001E51D7AE|nr:hypothetical protein [Pseudomonas quasicaspiana]MCD5979632.1 hypothetical protein [Pseudomonas quasicaspiana]
MMRNIRPIVFYVNTLTPLVAKRPAPTLNSASNSYSKSPSTTSHGAVYERLA